MCAGCQLEASGSGSGGGHGSGGTSAGSGGQGSGGTGSRGHGSGGSASGGSATGGTATGGNGSGGAASGGSGVTATGEEAAAVVRAAERGGGAGSGNGGSAAGGKTGSGGGGGTTTTLHGGASAKFVCDPGAASTFPANPLTGMGSVTMIKPDSATTPNYFAFVEGPVWIASLGLLVFSDNVSPERIWDLKPGMSPQVLKSMSGSNGLALDNDDKLIVTDQEMKRLYRADPTNAATVTVVVPAGSFKPNDAIVRSDGNIYVTDPDTGFCLVLDGEEADETDHDGEPSERHRAVARREHADRRRRRQRADSHPVAGRGRHGHDDHGQGVGDGDERHRRRDVHGLRGQPVARRDLGGYRGIRRPPPPRVDRDREHVELHVWR